MMAAAQDFLVSYERLVACLAGGLRSQGGDCFAFRDSGGRFYRDGYFQRSSAGAQFTTPHTGCQRTRRDAC
jgi:hypothetical protein